MKNLVRLSIAFVLVGSFVGLAWANRACETPDGTFDIMVSPKTIVLSSPCDTITVHSNIPYGAVVVTSVMINDVEVPFTKADDCGDLVAKIGIDALASFLTPNQDITLTLSGLLVNGNIFAVDETVAVKD